VITGRLSLGALYLDLQISPFSQNAHRFYYTRLVSYNISDSIEIEDMSTKLIDGSPLRRHRLLAPTAAVLVSPICLGGMNFGDAWKAKLGECDKETTFEILDYFYQMGGNFIDT
jgi:hypothetical protein